MDSCCENKAGELAQLRAKQSKILYIVLAINALGFIVEFIAGLMAQSTALLGDSLDMLGDASVYAVTLFVLHRSLKARAGAALFKGVFMLLFGLVVVADAVHKLMVQEVPAADWMGAIGLFALIANGICFALLYTHRSDDLNMRSTWLCSRNDLVANSSVILAAGLVAFTGSFWPDIIVGLAIAILFLHSAWQVLNEAWQQWKVAPAEIDPPLQAPSAVSCCDSSDVTASSCCSQPIQVAMPMPVSAKKSSCCDAIAPATPKNPCCG